MTQVLDISTMQQKVNTSYTGSFRFSSSLILKSKKRDFLGSPVVKTLPFKNAGSAGSIPGGGTKIPHALGPKNQNKKQ